MKKSLGLITAIFLLISPLVSASVYYVDTTSGSDNNNGLSEISAWKTLNKINNSSFSPGDMILFKRGEVWRENLIIQSSGINGNPIVFGAYGSGDKPQINGATIETGWEHISGNVYRKAFSSEPRVVVEDGMLLDFRTWNSDVSNTFPGVFPGSWACDYENNAAYVWCSDGSDPDSHIMEVSHNVSPEYIGVYVWNSSYIVVQDLDICHAALHGVYIVASQGIDISNVIIQRCDVFRNGRSGIRISNWANNGSTHPITSCSIKDNTVHENRYHGICLTYYVSDSKISNNLVYNNSWNDSAGFHGISSWSDRTSDRPTGNIIEFNRVYGTIAPKNIEGAGIQLDDLTDSTIVRYNISYRNQGFGFISHKTSDCIFYYNIAYENGRDNYDAGFYSFKSTNVQMYNNIAYNNKPSGFAVGMGSNITKIKNNIIAENETYEIRVYTDSQVNYTGDYNLVYHSAGGRYMLWDGSEYNWSDWKINSGQDANSPNPKDPKFMNVDNRNFMLKASSPAIDAGTNVDLIRDFAGNLVPSGQGIDIGAYEYISVDPLTVQMNATPTSGLIPLTVNFTGSASGGTSPYTYSWDFGDGSSSSAQNPSHTYTAAGNYTVTLTVTDNASGQDTASLSVNASEQTSPLRALATASPASGQAPLAVNFTGSASGGTSPYTYSWDFGDGNSSSVQNPSYTYSAAGNFTVNLIVRDSTSEQDAATLTISAYSNVSQVSLVVSTETGLPASGNGGTTEPAPGSHQYPAGSSVIISAAPNSGYRFSKWKGDLSSQGAFLQQASIMMDQDKSISALFCSKCGDVNGDLNISPADAQTAFDIFLGILSGLTECQKENADVNNDGTQTEPNVSPADAQAIFEYFLGINPLPGDCSCSSRSAETGILLRTETPVPREINLIINDIFVSPGEVISIPVIIDNPFGITAFGFDLLFESDVLEFIGVEKTEILKDFQQVKGNEIAKGLVRVGGYGSESVKSSSPDELVRLVFKVTKETPQRTFFLMMHLFDDLAQAHFQSGRRSEPVKRKNGFFYKIWKEK